MGNDKPDFEPWVALECQVGADKGTWGVLCRVPDPHSNFVEKVLVEGLTEEDATYIADLLLRGEKSKATEAGLKELLVGWRKSVELSAEHPQMRAGLMLCITELKELLGK